MTRLDSRGEAVAVFAAGGHARYRGRRGSRRILQHAIATVTAGSVSDVNNWWRYHPEDSAYDDEDDGVNPIVGGLSPTNDSSYLVTDTRHGEYTIVNWEPPRLMDPR